jgi:hypothetical protein
VSRGGVRWCCCFTVLFVSFFLLGVLGLLFLSGGGPPVSVSVSVETCPRSVQRGVSVVTLVSEVELGWRIGSDEHGDLTKEEENMYCT